MRGHTGLVFVVSRQLDSGELQNIERRTSCNMKEEELTECFGATTTGLRRYSAVRSPEEGSLWQPRGSTVAAAAAHRAQPQV